MDGQSISTCTFEYTAEIMDISRESPREQTTYLLTDTI